MTKQKIYNIIILLKGTEQKEAEQMKEEQKNTGAETGGSVASYYDIFLSAAAEFCKSRKIDDLTKISQNQFGALCYFINDKIFNGQKLNENIQLANDSNIYDVGCAYLRLCVEFDKVANPIDFCHLIKCQYNTFYNWLGGNTRESSASLKELTKRILENREQQAANKLLGNSGGQAVGILGYLNHYAGWNAPHMAGDEQQQKSRLSRSEVQQIATRNQSQIVLDLPTIQNAAAKIGKN